MKNSRVLPFERNRYFTGKMLTSADFQAEQNYVNNKRRFINQVMFGSGIVCGMTVYSIDELSVYVDSGVAIDGYGREIVIPSAYIAKLSTIEGFDGITGNRMRLYASYHEDAVQPVYSASKTERTDDYENNRVVENYSLYLVDAETVDKNFQLPSEFLSEGILYEDANFKVTLKMPATVCIGRKAKIKITVEKLSENDVRLSYSGLLQFPSFLDDAGKHEVMIDFANVELENHECISKDIWVRILNVNTKENNVLVKASSVTCYLNDVPRHVEQDVILKILSDEIEPRQLVNNEIGKTSFEMKTMSATDQDVCLAEIQIDRLTNSYEIRQISEKSVKRYIETPADAEDRKDYLDYFRTDITKEAVSNNESVVQTTSTVHTIDEYRTTGVVEIPIGGPKKRGDIVYSDEVMHGLGKGNVTVQLSRMIMENNDAIQRQTSAHIMGADDIFANDDLGESFDTAVKILNDKGSFVVGVRAKNNVDYLTVKYRWFATKYVTETSGVAEDELDSKRLIVETPTMILQPKETYYYNVKFNGMEAEQLGYELTEPSSGEIMPDGLYKAPDREGVYEIKIYCLSDPSICTYAYAIVKRK